MQKICGLFSFLSRLGLIAFEQAANSTKLESIILMKFP